METQAGLCELPRLVVDDRPSCHCGPVERRCDGDQSCPARPRRSLVVLAAGEVYRTDHPFPIALPLADIF
ncbi:hypothetical protein [Micromonospora tarensis]|uniref:hypothetical protein n=1 Tax=Micromonospora tarensis TaxID=2806100 RepID=UPI001EE44770|nr:hypothetical protein [Micromonospora tarensis]